MSLGNRNSQHSFAQIPSVHQARSVFDRSYAVKDTFDFDELTPCFVEEILPGDTINLSVKHFMRLAPQVKPVMDNMYIDWFFFFVPNRLVWDNWQKMMGEQLDPDDSTDFLVPQVNLNTVPGINEIFNHFGVQPIANQTVNALPFRAYNLIWNEWFRDQNLQDRVPVPKGDGPDSNATYQMLKGAKPHDYFTSALPWTQKGDPIAMPLGTTVPVVSNGLQPQFNNVAQTLGNRNLTGIGTSNVMYVSGAPMGTDQPMRFGTETGLRADLSAATAATINQFREAIMLQSLLELDARGGTRYVEILRAHFGVISPDSRLQRPEYLSGGRTTLQQHPVAQNSESGTTPQGNLAAFTTAAETGNAIGFSKSFVEHGFVIGMMRARGDVTYQQGLNRMWTRRTRWDYFWPKLQELGEQEILNKEIFVDGTAADNDVFGYQERYAEYRYHPSEIRGQFRSDYAQSLDVWHLAQDFTTRPLLNSTFIQSSTPISRSLVLPDPNYPALLADIWFNLKHTRPMQVFSVPATLGRF